MTACVSVMPWWNKVVNWSGGGSNTKVSKLHAERRIILAGIQSGNLAL